MSVPLTPAELDGLLKAVGNDIIRAYRDKYFPARVIQACPHLYSVENAANWVKPDKFCAFVAQALQEQSPPSTPVSTRRTELGSDSEHPPLKRVRGSSISLSSPAADDSTRPAPPTSSSFSGDSIDSGGSDDGAGTSAASVPQKRKRTYQKFRAPKPSAKVAAGLVRVTRQCWVNTVETMKEAPENWRVPDDGLSIAYVLDLTEDPHDYKDGKGKPLAMSAIIKHKCTDGWAGGSGGSLAKATTVTILGEDVKCQKMSHECRGSFVCSMASPDLWKGYKRYDHDVDIPPPVWPQSNNTRTEDYSKIEEALKFFNAIMKEKCHYDNHRCAGRPILKKHEQATSDGRYYFIGCSLWTRANMDRSHFARPIPRQIDEAILIPLFDTGRNNFSNTIIAGTPCTFQVPPRTGLKQRHCPHIHIKDGRIVEGIIQHRPCPAKITIFSPVDHTLRKAAIIPAAGVPHNHPSHPSDKLTRRAKAAVRAAGTIQDLPEDVPSTSPPDLNAHLGGIAPSNQLPPLLHLPPGPSLPTALLPSGYHMNQFY